MMGLIQLPGQRTVPFCPNCKALMMELNALRGRCGDLDERERIAVTAAQHARNLMRLCGIVGTKRCTDDYNGKEIVIRVSLDEFNVEKSWFIKKYRDMVLEFYKMVGITEPDEMKGGKNGNDSEKTGLENATGNTEGCRRDDQGLSGKEHGCSETSTSEASGAGTVRPVSDDRNQKKS